MTSNRWILGLSVALLMAISVPQSWAEDPPQAKEAPGPGATAAAVASDVFYVPGKAIVCTASGVLGVVTMALTFGTLYQEAADFVKGGCGGQWLLTGADIKPAKSY